MPDPVSVGLILAPKLIGFATAAYTAIWSDGLGKADAKALKSLIDVSGALRKAWQGRHPDASNLDVMSRHTALVGAAFMAAFRDQDEIFKAGLEKKDRAADISARLATGLEASVDPAGWAELLQRDATASPVYHALRMQFADGDLFSLDQHAFAARYRLAWAQLLATEAGKPVRAAILAAPGAQGHHLRYLVAQQMVSWRAESLLGEVEQLLDGAPLPLQGAYVEPITGSEYRAGPPILRALRRWLADDSHLIGAVTAPFGHGKSLTARVLSSVLAEAWLADGPKPDFNLSRWQNGPSDPFRPDPWFTNRPQPDRWFPVYVACRQTGLNPSAIQTAITRALKAQLTAQGVQLSTKDINTRWPDDQQNRLIILDGLDEVHLRPDAQQALVDALSDETSARCRFLIFTRPAALPNGLRKECATFPLRHFNEVQIDTWLTPWNACHQTDITREAIDTKGLLTLARTPILLYMIARTWPELPQNDEAVPEVEVYEKFFNLLATTKLDMSHQPVVLATAEQIRAALADRDPLNDATPKDGLLWLLARLAWAHACEQAAGRPLTRKAIERLLHAELDIEDEIDAVISGLMLVMRADPTHRNPPFDFSHQSFKEFLIACHWRNEVLKSTPDERMLMGARLLEDESKAPRFLLELLKQDSARQEQAARWAGQCFLNPRLGWRAPKGAPDYCDDPLQDERGLVREAALMLRCALDAEPLGLDDVRGLASLVGGLRIQGKFCVLRAPRLIAHRVDLRGADLQGADLQGARLQRARLQGANLQWAHLRGADLWEADLRGAHLRGAHLRGAHLRGADLQGAHLRGADLQGAHLQGAHLQGAAFEDANLEYANFKDANLEGANFTGAHLGNGNYRVRNLHLAKNLDQAIRPEGWGDLLTNPQIWPPLPRRKIPPNVPPPGQGRPAGKAAP